jgi:hypothetical protein
MNSLLIYPLSFLLAVLWFKPIQDGEQRVLLFAVATTFDLLALLIFLLQRQIGYWHDILISDIEKGHLREGSFDDASNKHVGQGNEQTELRDFGTRPDILQSEIHEFQVQGLNYDINAISARDVRSSIGSNTIRLPPPRVVGTPGGPAASDRRYDQSAGWPTEMVQTIWGGQEIEERQADPELGRRERENGFFINVGMDNSANSKSEIIHSPRPVGIPVTIISSDIHPALRSTFQSISRPVSPNNFQTPKHAPSYLEKKVLERNEI